MKIQSINRLVNPHDIGALAVFLAAAAKVDFRSDVLAAMIPARYAGAGVGEGFPTDRAIPAAA